ncbi:putative macrophage migration inhibitory factor [Rosa chinensis]|uniref:Putative macrophage migration inhibitory factor n=1 Tax=Rosa chinensis TaxID=74649 RepID=A0A2P6PAT6_ROSCH|nr:putative macrophage migration inhibitory factor [Rosa chinensis]
MILLNGIVPISYAGTKEPVAYGELISIWGIGLSVRATPLLQQLPHILFFFFYFREKRNFKYTPLIT